MAEENKEIVILNKLSNLITGSSKQIVDNITEESAKDDNNANPVRVIPLPPIQKQ